MEGELPVREEFRISVEEWLASDATDPVERDTNADISITIGANRVTEVEDIQAGTVRTSIRASAGLLAFWLLDNWWRLICEPDSNITATEDLSWGMSHAWPAIGGGYVWPDLLFRGSDGSQIAVECKRTLIREHDAYSPIRYLNSFSAFIPVETFEKSVSAFIERVLERLGSRGTRKSELHDMWKDVQRERTNQKASRYRKLEALLGLDADEREALVSALLNKWPRSIGMQALEEISASTGSDNIEAVLSRAKQASQSVRTFGKLPNLGHLDKGGNIPWLRGQEAAYALRDDWGLKFEPISEDLLADRLEMLPAKLNEFNRNVPFSMAIPGRTDEHVGFVLNRPRKESRRFDIARLIGDHIYFESKDQLRPATTALTVRQKFQRAFAAEFLCPSQLVKDRISFSPGGNLGDEVADLASEFDVSEKIVFHHLENRDIVSHEIAQDMLRFA